MPDIAALCEAALGRQLGPGPIAVAVSGGPDSSALLLLAAAAWGDRVAALTVDHRLRPESTAEADFVAAECQARGIRHATLGWAQPQAGAGLQAAARAARYALMADWCTANGAAVLLTAHHADDQAETMLMRLARGSGSGGLAGIRARRELVPGVMLLRPLLGVRRAVLGGIAKAAGWPVIDDPSNRDPRFTRVRARALLAGNPWLDAEAMAAAAAHLADAEAALGWAADRAWAGGAVVGDGAVMLDAAGLPAELQHRLVRRAIAVLAPAAAPRGPDVARLLERLAKGGTGTLAGVRVAARAGGWRFTRAAPHRVSLGESG